MSEGTFRREKMFYVVVEGERDENETSRAQRCLSLFQVVIAKNLVVQ